MLPLGRVCKQPLRSLTRICQNSKLTNPSAYGTSPNLGEERPQAVLCSGQVGALPNLAMPSDLVPL